MQSPDHQLCGCLELEPARAGLPNEAVDAETPTTRKCDFECRDSKGCNYPEDCDCRSVPRFERGAVTRETAELRGVTGQESRGWLTSR